eukprot:1106423_1
MNITANTTTIINPVVSQPPSKIRTWSIVVYIPLISSSVAYHGTTFGPPYHSSRPSIVPDLEVAYHTKSGGPSVPLTSVTSPITQISSAQQYVSKWTPSLATNSCASHVDG